MKAASLRKRWGFTLIEILIALTLFSLILVMVFSTLHSSNKSWQASDKQSELNDERRLVFNFIRKQLSETVPLILIDGKKNAVIFKGEPEQAYFVSRLPAHRGGGGLHLLSLAVSKQEDDSSLILRYQAITADMDLYEDHPDEDIETVSLINNVDSIEYAYFGQKNEDKKPSWYDEWKDEERLPRMLRIQISSKDSSFWPELFVNIRTQMERGQAQLTLHKPKSIGSGSG